MHERAPLPEQPSAAQADAERRAVVAGVAEMMGELVEFWGFKASMGRVWTTLYLAPAPLSADQVVDETGLSVGAVSMALSELGQWGLVERVARPGARKRFYEADTDVWGVVRRIVRERELRLVARSIERFAEAARRLEALQASAPSDHTAFVLARVRGLHALARTGYTLVEGLADVGQFTLAPIRGVLNRAFGAARAVGGSRAGDPPADP